jgi:glyoxylase-like metal-dependent hydrolase (beta-lactamase superfamily II)
MSDLPICVTCGVQHAGPGTPPRCAICEDERQYVGSGGQQWTTLAALRETHRNVLAEEEPGLHSIRTEPRFGIGQRAFLVQTPEGNVLWDCVTLLDAQTEQAIRDLGGITAVAVSHPHYYSSIVEWSRAFGGAPIHLHEADREWAMRVDPAVRFWSSDPPALPGGLRLVHTGGHFAGYQVLWRPDGAGGGGVLLAGDQPFVCMDPRWVSFMWSYPNLIPLGPATIREVAARLEPLPFTRLYGAFQGQVICEDASGAVQRSAERYLRHVADG